MEVADEEAILGTVLINEEDIHNDVVNLEAEENNSDPDIDDTKNQLIISKNDETEYTNDEQNYIIAINIGSIFIWIIIILYLGLQKEYGFVILLIPIFLFLVGIYNSNVVTKEQSVIIFNVTNLSVALFVAIPVFSLIHQHYPIIGKKILRIVFLAIFLLVSSMISIWVSKDTNYLVNQIRSNLQTMGISLIMYCIINYFVHTTE